LSHPPFDPFYHPFMPVSRTNGHTWAATTDLILVHYLVELPTPNEV
jgi:hypothetical protein